MSLAATGGTTERAADLTETGVFSVRGILQLCLQGPRDQPASKNCRLENYARSSPQFSPQPSRNYARKQPEMMSAFLDFNVVFFRFGFLGILFCTGSKQMSLPKDPLVELG